MASDLCFGKNLLAQVESRLGGSLSCLRHKLGRNLGAGMAAFRLLPYGGLAGHACLVGVLPLSGEDRDLMFVAAEGRWGGSEDQEGTVS